MENMREYEVILKSGAKINVIATKLDMETSLKEISGVLAFDYNNRNTYVQRKEIAAVDEIAIIEPNEE